MGSSLSRLRLAALIPLVATALALAVTAAPARAGLGISCPATTTTPFRPWSDTANYAYVPGGGFEAATTGWTLAGGASVVSGNERYYIHSTADKSSLRLPKGATATSPPMCIALLSSKMRFVLGGTSGAQVHVQVIYNGLVSSVLGIFDGATVTSNGTWQPSPQISMLGGVLPLLTQSVQFRFVSTSGTPLLDDVYLDPWKVT